VKILDFGLAKLLRRPALAGFSDGTGEDHLTTKGVTIGTVAYMSPEQVTGEQLDGRTDLFSLGVVLYECVTGHRPFTGKTSAVIFSAILNRAPVAPVVLNPEIPLPLQEIINNCLEKDRELRYQDAAGLRADLKRLKRDLDPFHSEIAATSLGSAAEPGVAGADAKARPSTRASRPSGSEAAQAPPGSGLHPTRSWAGVALTVTVAMALTAAVSYLVWSGSPLRENDVVPEPAQSDSTAQSRLALAAARLEAKDFRAAAAYAEEVLQLAPGDAEATRVRDTARGMLARADEAIARAEQLLAAGNVNGASEALEAARSIDPASPAVSAMSARLVSRLRSDADAARLRAQQQPPPAGPAGRGATREQTPRPSQPAPTAGESSTPTAAAQSTSPPSISAAASPPPAPASPPTSQPAAAVPGASGAAPSLPSGAQSPPASGSAAASAPAPQSGQPSAPQSPPAQGTAPAPPPAIPPSAPANSAARGTEPSPVPSDGPARGRGTGAAAPVQAEDDDAAIRRVVATYARAIETKDVALFRSVKPSLSPEEQRRIEEGFRAVASQRVAVTILSITRKGNDAVVRLSRRDTISAGGRQQTRESQQTLTMTRTGSEWVIREIG
jgi:hypothetical protein